MLYGDDKLMDLFLIATYGLPQDRAKAMRNEYEALLATRNEEIGQLREEYQKLMVAWAGAVQLQDEYKARIAELERQAEKREAELIRQVDCVIDLQPQLRAAQAEINRLRQLVYLAHDTECTCEICVAMPHNPIICCICNKPIEGDDLDSRFWLHAKGCKFSETGECDCDLECHAECYPGHEAEYAPLFDDDEDDEELP